MTAVTAAERILLALGVSDPTEIDLEAIAWSRGALVEYRPLDGCDATIVERDLALTAVDEWPALKITGTVVGGAVVHSAGLG